MHSGKTLTNMSSSQVKGMVFIEIIDGKSIFSKISFDGIDVSLTFRPVSMIAGDENE